ncbi:MAG: zf-HC2 domain-containing protein [Cytophagales bacterium]|nr:zf-HC2 domain-containing protein [Cytophagales bacterium]
MDKQEKLYRQLFEPTKDCPTNEQLLKYAQNALSTQEMHEIEKHLLSCEACNEAMDGLLLFENPDTLTQYDKEIRSSFRVSKTNYLKIAAMFAGLLVSLSTVFLLFQNLSDNTYAEMAMETEPMMNATKQIEEISATEGITEEEEALLEEIVEKQEMSTRERQTQSITKQIATKKEKIAPTNKDSYNSQPTTTSSSLTSPPPNDPTVSGNNLEKDIIIVESTVEDNEIIEEFEDESTVEIQEVHAKKIANQQRQYGGSNYSTKAKNNHSTNIKEQYKRLSLLLIDDKTNPTFQKLSSGQYPQALKEYQQGTNTFATTLCFIFMENFEEAKKLSESIKDENAQLWIESLISLEEGKKYKTKRSLKKLTKEEHKFQDSALELLKLLNN